MTQPNQLRDRIKALIEVEIDQIVGYSLGNPVARSKDDEALLDASLETNGYAQPVIVFENEDCRYEILDGHGRIDRIRELYPDTKRIKVLVLDVATAEEGRTFLLGYRNSAPWDIEQLDAWMAAGLENGMDLETAMELSGLTAHDLGAFGAGDLEIDDDDDGDDEDGDKDDHRPQQSGPKRASLLFDTADWEELKETLGGVPTAKEVLRWVKLGKRAGITPTTEARGTLLSIGAKAKKTKP